MERNGQLAPAVLLNTIPKSGTNLLNQIVLGIPGTTLCPDVLYEGTDPSTESLLLQSLQPGGVMMGHLYHSRKWAELLQREGVRTVFLYRDLRDILISLTYYIVEKVPAYPIYEDLKACPSQKDRYLLLIRGIRDYPGIRQWFQLFEGWMSEQDVLPVSYESLMLPHLRTDAVRRIAEHIWMGLTPPLPIEELAEMMEQNINPDFSHTIRKAVVSGWREEFDEEILAAFKQAAGDILIRTGYEEDDSWI